MEYFEEFCKIEGDKALFSIMLDSYEIFELIGKGGAGRVYRAYHKRLKKQVVIKVVHADKERGRIEADILKTLKSPYLPQIYDILETGSFVLTVMEFIPGESLGSLLRKGHIFSVKQVYQWSLKLIRALSYIHSQSPPVIHADIKPDNIILKKDGSICLIDFSISSLYRNGSVKLFGGTRGYAAPEQTAGIEYRAYCEWEVTKTESLGIFPEAGGAVDCRADIYSFGAVLCHLITGKKPQVSIRDNTAMSEKCIGVYHGFGLIIQRAMEPDRKKRFQTAAEIEEALIQIGRMDSRYCSLNKFRKRMIFALRTVFLLSGTLAAVGYSLFKIELSFAYRSLVAKIEDCRLRGEYSEMELFYDRAVKMEKERDDAGIQMALSYYERGRYRDGISYIKVNLLFRSFRKGDAKDRIFSILANCYFQLGDYETAAGYFKRAIEENPKSEENSRNCIIALIRMGELEEAEAMIEQGEFSDISLAFIQGELYFYQKDYRQALEKFLFCINEDGKEKNQEERRIKALGMTAESYRAMGEFDEEIKILAAAKSGVPYIYQRESIEQLARAYIRRGNIRDSDSDGEQAAGELRELKKRGWSSYENGITLSLLYQRLGRYSEALEELEEMLLLYGENCEIYIRLAFLEADKQSKIEYSERSYQCFRIYYIEASKRYQKESVYRGIDSDMSVLEALYLGIERGGWFYE